MQYTVNQAAAELNVTPATIRNWARKGKIKTTRTPGGHRRINGDELNRLKGEQPTTNNRVTALYARVSKNTKPAQEDLNRQTQVLELYAAAHGWEYIIIQDVGSGLNYDKPGLKELIKLIETNQIERLVINYKDRLLRFGAEIIFQICKYHDVEVVIINQSESSPEAEIVDDVLSIITVCSSKLYGSRSKKNKKIIEESRRMFEDERDETREVNNDEKDSETIHGTTE